MKTASNVNNNVMEPEDNSIVPDDNNQESPEADLSPEPVITPEVTLCRSFLFLIGNGKSQEKEVRRAQKFNRS